jgi:Tol biopolymer transport system component
VWFIDHPSETQPAGLWGINTDGGEPQFITARPGFYSRDGSLIAYPENGRAYIEQVADGVRWEAPTGGRSFTFSPDVTRIAWQINFSTFNFDRRTVEVWMANVDGSNARSVAQLTGGGLLGWFPDSARLLVTNRESPGADITLAVLSLAEGSLTPLVQSPTLRGGLISPEGGWIAYQITFSGDAANDGLWVIRSDGRDARRLDIFGSYRWRAEGQLVVVPLESISGAQSHRLIQLDAATGMAAPLTDPALTPFRIANGDWAVSLDGSQIVFLSADDRNLWLIALP